MLTQIIWPLKMCFSFILNENIIIMFEFYLQMHVHLCCFINLGHHLYVTCIFKTPKHQLISTFGKNFKLKNDTIWNWEIKYIATGKCLISSGRCFLLHQLFTLPPCIRVRSRNRKIILEWREYQFTTDYTILSSFWNMFSFCVSVEIDIPREVGLKM